MLSGIDPKVDYAFKWLFGRVETLPILINLLNAVLDPAPGKQIVEIKLLNPFNSKDHVDDKLSIVDVKACDNQGRFFDIEMQMCGEETFPNRILYYWARMHQEQLLAGNDYNLLRPTISIAFVNSILFPEINDYSLQYSLYNLKNRHVLCSDILVVILELPKFKLGPEEIANQLDTWLYFLRNADTIDSEKLPKALNQAVIRQAFEELIVLSHDEMERQRYEAAWRLQLDENTRIANAKKREAKGREEGREEGRQEGLKEGLREGQASLILLQLSSKLGEIDENAQNRIQSLSMDELQKLGKALLSFRANEDLQKWFERQTT